MKTMEQIHAAYRDGDPLTDAELLAGIEYFDGLARMAAAAGPVYSLMTKDARMVAATLNDFYTSRIWHRQNK
jgi:hypothetical protein